mgnify:CR=1 FL=1
MTLAENRTGKIQQSPSELLGLIRAEPPLVQCITNFVAMNIAANVLLAAGASPAMVGDAEEAGEFAQIAGALTVNIGTLSPQMMEGARAAIAGAHAAGRPWVLDPVACQATDVHGRVQIPCEEYAFFAFRAVSIFFSDGKYHASGFQNPDFVPNPKVQTTTPQETTVHYGRR